MSLNSEIAKNIILRLQNFKKLDLISLSCHLIKFFVLSINVITKRRNELQHITGQTYLWAWGKTGNLYSKLFI